MAKLHELLAVESDLRSVFTKILIETTATFTKRTDHFKSFLRTLKWYDDDKPPAPEERKALDTTVQAKLDYQRKHIVRYLDAVLQKEATNQIACANIVIDDKTIAEKVPAGFLLGLEKYLSNIRSVYSAIPTLAPGINWDPDPSEGEGIYKRRHPDESYKTEQRIVAQVLYEATKEHPAQVDKISETANIGLYTRNEWCSMLTPAEKSKLLDRIDSLLKAVKKARQRANSANVDGSLAIGDKLFDYIHDN